MFFLGLDFQSLLDHLACLSVKARLKMALFSVTFYTGSLLGEEQEDEIDTRCIVSE